MRLGVKKFRKHSMATLVVVALTLGLVGIVRALTTTVNLGAADGFAVLAGSAITNTGASVINGDLGVSPGSSVTGFPPGTVNGTQHVADTEAANAQTALTTAYNDAAGRTPVSTVPTELGGTTKNTGVYDSTAGTFGITGTLTLDAQGDPNAVFIFKTASTLISAGSSSVSLINGAQACNVFWQVGSSATLGANSTFKGNIMALTAITLTTGANVEGRVLARNAAVTLDTNNITKATCVAPPTSPPPPAAAPPLINVKKVPAPLTLPSGPGSVTYNYTLTNVGTVAMSNITVTDNKCSTVGFISGDTNGDSKLDVSETWDYSCTTTVSQTTTNTVTASGQANGFTSTDTANATVVVSSSSAPPLIHMVKKPSVFVLPTTGGAVTYTYTVTNPGTAALSNVSLVDNKCTSISAPSGDTNSNNLLEASETWAYTCQATLSESTTNIGTAQGSANGLTAIDFSPATVVVTPTLPNAGIAPKNNDGIWNIIIPTGVIVALCSLYLARKKQVTK